MKLSKTCGGRGVSSVLNRVFPFRLRYRLGVQNAAAAFGRGRFSFRAKTKTGSRSFGGDNNRRERGQTKSLVELTDWIAELNTDSLTVTAPQTDRGGGGESVDLGTRGGSGTNEFSNSKRPRDDSVGHFDDTRNGTSSKIPRKGGPMSSASTPFLRVHSDEDGEVSPRGRANGAQGAAVSSPVSEGGTAVDSQSSYARCGNVQTGGKQQSLLTTDEDKEGEMSGFSNLLSGDEEDSHVDDDLKGLELTQEDNVQKPAPKTSTGQNDLKGLRLTQEDNVQKPAPKTSTGQNDLKGLRLTQEDNVQKPAPKTSTGQTGFYLSETRFDQCSVSPLTLKGIKDAGYARMTVVQEATLPVILKGKDILAKAKTGTGKTLAFLLPAIEAIVRSPHIDHDQERPPVFVLVICPTRELASQVAVEANTLLKYHPSLGVQVVIGGVRLASDKKRLQANPCQILVATPGRLADHIKNTAGFSTQLMGVKVLVLDEADHLLDMGFRKDIENIIAAIPKQRQTLFFSATVPQEVRQICQVALKRDHEYINTVEEGSEETHSQVTQMHLVAPLDEHFSLLYVLLKEHISDDVDYKVIVFCTTAMVTKLVASLLSELNLNVREIHSRKNQSYRKRVSDEFRKSKGLILVTSDVSARGVDYPDVTLVIQVGLPSDREQYIHRLGRTGRKGKEGQGILLLAPWEAFFLSKLKDLPITKASSVPGVDPDMKKKVERALSHVDMNCKESAYQAWLGFYNSNKTLGKNKCGLVKLANEFSRSMGLDNPPAIPELVLGKMGLYNVPGLRCKSPEFPWFEI